MSISKFTTWLLENRSISDFTKWLLMEEAILLSDDVYVPTFHETLAEYCKRELAYTYACVTWLANVTRQPHFGCLILSHINSILAFPLIDLFNVFP